MKFSLKIVVFLALFALIATASAYFDVPVLPSLSKPLTVNLPSLLNLLQSAKQDIRGLILTAPGSCTQPVPNGTANGGPWSGSHACKPEWESWNGTDVFAPLCSPEYAVVDGVICGNFGVINCTEGDGLYGVRLHLCGTDGNEYYYAHMKQAVVSPNQQVTAGQLLGYMGNPAGGPHLHTSVRPIAGCPGDPKGQQYYDFLRRASDSCVSPGPYSSYPGVAVGASQCGTCDGVVPPPPPPPPPPPGSGGYSICQDQKCIKVDGVGISQCYLDADCRTSHTTCLGFQCIVVPEPGKDECEVGSNKLLDFSGKCPLPSHKACVTMGLGPLCAIVPGPGSDSCKTDIDCAPANGPPLGPF